MSEVIDKKSILEAAIFAAGEPVSVDRLLQLFDEADRPAQKEIISLLDELAMSYAERAVELVQVASGYRFQARANMAPWLQRLWDQKPVRYTRAFLETLALIAYRQPITRGEIEEIRGVAVNSHIMRQLLEREWIKVVGHKDVAGKPELFATTKQFLDYFNLTKLAELPLLQDVVDLDKVDETLGEQLTLEVTVGESINEADNAPLMTDTQRDILRKQNAEQAERDIDALVDEALARVDALEEALA